MDVHPDLRPILQYKIGAQHCRHGRGPVEIRSARGMPYVMDMAEALGRPYLEQPIYVVSPLTLGGESFECALAGRARLESVWVSDMTSVGATTPIRLGDAAALAVAEVVGAAIVAREVVGLPVGWSIRLCPFDPRAMALSLGSPEEVLLQWASEEVNAFYHGVQPGPPSGSLHSQSKLPDAQAAAERMSAMTMSALLGTRIFGNGGCLSLDEVFSPEQLVIDCEMRDHVEKLTAGVDDEFDADSCLAEIATGLDGGYLGTDTTSRLYRSTYWLPLLFERRSVGGWKTEPGSDLRARAKAAVREARRRHEYELEPDLMREVDRIYEAARRELDR